MLDELLARFARHDRHALSRLLTLLARGEHSADVFQRIKGQIGSSLVIAITGGAGVGKSSLIGRLLERIRAAGKTVAVLACDPQSPLTGGALLGDRFRMPANPDDDGVFIRSLAAAGGRGALAEHLDDLIRLLEAFPFDVIVLETVGAGQGDTSVSNLVDAVVVLLQPETGDDLQWEKAGMLEVADVLVLHKADLPTAPHVEAQVRTMLGLGNRPMPPLLAVSSRTGTGAEQLWETIRALPRRRRAIDGVATLVRKAQEILAERFATRHNDPAIQNLLRSWQKGSMDAKQAAVRLLDCLGEPGA